MERIIEISDVSMIRDGRHILDNINLTVCRGDFIAVTGPNGGGKTTLLRILLKLLRPSSGEVRYVADEKTKNFPTIGYLPQKNLVDNRFPITVRELVTSGLLSVPGLSKEEKRIKVDRILSLIELENYSENTIGELSGGQLQRTLLGRAIVSEPEVLVLDEPLSYLDKKFEKKIYKIISDLSSHATIILVSHEMSTIAGMANRHLIVDHSLHECSAEHHYIHSECDDLIC